MKKIKRIICIVLTIITCFSAFACSGWGGSSDVKSSKEYKSGKIEAEKQKTVFDNLTVKVSGYKLMIDYNGLVSETDSNWVLLEYWSYRHAFGIYSGVYNESLVTGKISLDVSGWTFSLESEEDETIKKSIKIGLYDINAEYDLIESYKHDAIKAHLYCCDGVWFLIIQGIPEIFVEVGYFMANRNVPPLFYLLDFENGVIKYAGYANGWYERMEKRNYTINLGLNLGTVQVVKEE